MGNLGGSHPKVTLCEQALAAWLWTKQRRLSNVSHSAMEAWKVPRGRNGWIRPTTVLHGTQDATAGDRVHRPLIATAHRQGFGLNGRSTNATGKAVTWRLAVSQRYIATNGSFSSRRTQALTADRDLVPRVGRRLDDNYLLSKDDVRLVEMNIV